MATVTGYALRLPNSIMEEVKLAAEKDATSINQFILVSVVQRLTELKTKRYFEERAARASADPLAGIAILSKAGADNPISPREGDEIPEGWWDEQNVTGISANRA